MNFSTNLHIMNFYFLLHHIITYMYSIIYAKIINVVQHQCFIFDKYRATRRNIRRALLTNSSIKLYQVA